MSCWCEKYPLFTKGFAMQRNLLAFMFGMQKCLIVLLCVASPVIHAQAADPGDQLLGFWRPDMTKTLALAKKSNRELDPIMQNIMGKMVFEFQKDKMIVHGPPGFSSDNPPVAYSVKAVDQTAGSLTLSANDKELKVRFYNGQMALNDPEQGWIVFNRMSAEDFAKRDAAGAKNVATNNERSGGSKAPGAGEREELAAQPIPDRPAAGKVHGKEFKVEKATLESGNLKLQQGEGFFGDLSFNIVLFGEDSEKFDGKKIMEKPNQESSSVHVHMIYKEEGKGGPTTQIITENISMKLEFGNSKDGKIPGKIHLRLADEAGSFVVGTFEAEIE
jgi:hypothetical protein